MVYVCDEDFVAPSLVSCQSFSAKYYDDVDRFIFICAESDDFVERARHYCAENKINIQILQMNITAAKNFPLLAHLRPAAYGRLFLQDYLKASYSRVLYIDGDTLSGPVDIDFNADLSGKILGAVQDIGVVASGGAAQLLHQPPEQDAKYFKGTSKNCPDVGSAIGLSGKLAGECGDGADGFFRSFGPLRESGH